MEEARRFAFSQRIVLGSLATIQLITENQVIVAETLNVKGMLKNHKLAQAINDASWGELIRQLEYKANWYGRTFIKIDQMKQEITVVRL